MSFPRMNGNAVLLPDGRPGAKAVPEHGPVSGAVRPGHRDVEHHGGAVCPAHVSLDRGAVAGRASPLGRGGSWADPESDERRDLLRTRTCSEDRTRPRPRLSGTRHSSPCPVPRLRHHAGRDDGSRSITHAIDDGQRYLDLSFSHVGDDLVVTSPPNGNQAPPGWYMLFVLKLGQCSVGASWIQSRN